MVELYSLQLLGKDGELTGIDQDVAQLEFENSLIEASVLESMALDPTLISTDSLDTDRLRIRCETNKNDYKITFDDSGQWTTSGIGGVSPDESPPATAADNLTTWGRIRSTEPFDDKTTSLPELSRRPGTAASNPVVTRANGTSAMRPASLVANFVDRQPDDYEYSETYMGDGRYLDMNDNEIGFVPPCTAGIQHTGRPTHPLRPPRRTFADLASPSSTTNATGASKGAAPALPASLLRDAAPELKFLSLPFEVPSFCQQQSSSLHLPTLDDLLRQTKQSHLPNLCDKRFDEKMAEFAPPSTTTTAETFGATAGPSHIEDWPSLALLLPKHVVEACSFFKMNSHVLTGSSNLEGKVRPTTSVGAVPRSSSHQKCCSMNKDLSADSGFVGSRTRCDCQTQSLISAPAHSASSRSRLCMSSKLKLHAQELGIIGLPSYNAKRALVERVVEGVAEMTRGASSKALCAALEALLADGLMPHLSSWDMVVAVTAPGPATSGQGVFQLVKQLEASEKPSNSRSLIFFKELLRLRSLDGWLSYVVLKENVLSRLYHPEAFLLRANTAFRSLFWRLVESLELLSVLEQRPQRQRGDSGVGAESSTWGSASRIASDSRVPKSSSVPSKLVNETAPSTPVATAAAVRPVTPRPRTPVSSTHSVAPAAAVRSPMAATETPVERPRTLRVTPAPAPRTPTPPTRHIPSPSPSTASTSLRRSRIPVPNSNASSTLSSTYSTRSRTPTVASTSTAASPFVGAGPATSKLMSKASSPTRLPLYRRAQPQQYGARALSQQRPLTSGVLAGTAGLGSCRFESVGANSRRPGASSVRVRKYLA